MRRVRDIRSRLSGLDRIQGPIGSWLCERADLQLNSTEKPERNDEKGWKRSSTASGDGASPHFPRLLFAGLAKYTPIYQRI